MKRSVCVLLSVSWTVAGSYNFDWAKGRLARPNQKVGKAVDLENCPVQFEIIQAQDVTVSFSPLIAAMNGLMAGLLTDLQTNYPKSKFGLASFADKPIPFSGYGTYAAYPFNYISDVCYRQVQELTSDITAGSEAVSRLRVSGGADYPENSWGGMINAALDPRSGWTGHEVDPETNIPILRVILGITDALSHVPGDAAENIDLWNELWGTNEMPAWAIEWGGTCSKTSANWARIVTLATKYRADPSSLTAAEETEFTDLRELCGPWKYPAPVANDGTFGASCSATEYPSVGQLKAALESVGPHGLIPVMVTPSSDLNVMPWIQSFDGCPTAQTEAQCIKEWWQLSLTNAGIQGLFYALEVADDAPTLIGIIEFALETLHILWCEAQTTTSSTLPPTTTESEGSTVTTTSTTSITLPPPITLTLPTPTETTETTTSTTATTTTSCTSTPAPCEPCGHSECCPESMRMKISDLPKLYDILNNLPKSN